MGFFDGLLGGLTSGIASIFDTSQNNKNAQAMQQEQERYNTEMSSTAYQRASTDMKAAGLNPMMMASGGMSASSPTMTPQPTQKSNMAGAISGGLSSAIQAQTIDKLVEEIAKTKAEVVTESVKPDNIMADTGKKLAETTTEDQKPALIQAETAKVKSGASNLEADTATKRALLPVAQNSAKTATNESEINPTVRKVLDILGYSGGKVSKGIAPITDAISSARAARLFHN